MPTDIVIPTVGESVTEGVIGAWLKSDGDYVDRDEPILEIETDKITVEVPAPVAGLIKTGAGEGETVQVGAVVGSIDESAAAPAAKQESASAPSATATKEHAGSEAQPPASVSKNGAASASDDIRMTPLARKIADENGVNASAITGTGPGGRIREQDVIAFMQTGAVAAAASKPASAASASAPQPSSRLGSREITRERMKPLRQKIAQRLVEAQHTAAMLTTFNECDMSQVMALRARHKEAFQKKHGVKLGFMSFFMKAAVSALESYPLVNAQIATGDSGPEILKHHYCDIAVAVGTKKGLVVPVVRNCESLSFAQIESALVDLATRARDGKLSLEEMQGGTFTISNGGVYGSMMSTPILNPPQSGILGMHNIIRRPVEHPDKPGSGEVVVRPMMYLALSYDHRVVDGAGAVGFLKHIKENIESPESMLLGM